MAELGDYHILTELARGPLGSVSRVRSPYFPGDLALKVFDPAMMGLLEADAATQAFLDRVGMQKLLASRGAKSWAPIHDLQATHEGAFYVTDFYPLTAQKLIADHAPATSGGLMAVVGGAVKGLLELRARRRRAHANLKPTNVLIGGTIEPLASATVFLIDPATEGGKPEHFAADLLALGELIHELVLHRPFRPRAAAAGTAGTAGYFDDLDHTTDAATARTTAVAVKPTWPVPASAEWARLGRTGGRWRDLCNWLLDPNPAARPESLEGVVDALRDLVPRRRLRLPRLPGPRLAVAAVVLAVVAGLGGVVLHRAHATAKAELSSVDQAWFGAFEQALRDPARRQAYQADPDLKDVVAELDRAAAAGVSFDPAATPTLSWTGYQRTRDALATVDRVRQDLAPAHWRKLTEAAATQRQYEARHWEQPAAFVARLVREAQPTPGGSVALGIDQFTRAWAAVARTAPRVEQAWAPLDADLREVEAPRDDVLTAFAAALRRAAVAQVRCGDDGLAGEVELAALAPQAARLAAVVRGGFPAQYARARFARDVESRLNLVQPKAADIDDWLANVDGYALVALDDAAKPVLAVRRAMAKLVADVARQPLSADERAPFEPVRRQLQAKVDDFLAARYTKRDAAQENGEVALRWGGIQRELDALRKEWVKLEDPLDWVATVDQPLPATSEQVRQRWRAWTEWLKTRADALAADQRAFNAVKRATEDLKAQLASLDETFPPVPLGLTETFAAAAWDRRERDLATLSQWAAPPTTGGGGASPATGPSATVPASNAPPDADAIKAAGERFVAWCGNLKDLAKDFPLATQVLTPADRPDAKWLAKAKDFWLDPAVQALVRRDVARIAGVQAVGAAPRDKLVDLAGKAETTEVALAAWRRLGTTDGPGAVAGPAWPTRRGELDQELALRNRLGEGIKSVRDAALREALLADVRAQGPARWRRFASVAAGPEALGEAARLRASFGVNAAELAKLDPAPRFNLALYAGRVAVGDPSPANLRAAVDELRSAGTDLRALPDVADLLVRLARINDPEPIAARLNAPRPPVAAAAGDAVALPIKDSPYGLTFARVAPPGMRPFYLCTTEVSVGQFIDLVNAGGAWPEANALLGNLGGASTPPRGPQAWGRPGSASQPIARYDTWRFDNAQPFDLDPALRAGRFNRNALAKEYGDSPRYEHPMQQAPAQAALYAAALTGCRLPTPREWVAAYEQERRKVPDEDWRPNLRDQAWRIQYDYTVANRIAQWPDANLAGVFWPRGLARPAQPRVHPINDGTLYFRTVDTPDRAAPAGGAAAVSPASAPTFLNLIGNVAEFVCDAPDAFDGWTAARTADGIAAFLRTIGNGHVYVVGGSALSAPELDPTRPYPANSPAEPYADVGFRLAFTAPAASVAERLRWVLDEQQFLPVAATASAKAGQQ